MNMHESDPGMIVKMKDGSQGRTYNSKGMINGKVPVHVCIKKKTTHIPGLDVCVEYSSTGILCDPKSLTQIGFID